MGCIESQHIIPRQQNIEYHLIDMTDDEPNTVGIEDENLDEKRQKLIKQANITILNATNLLRNHNNAKEFTPQMVMQLIGMTRDLSHVIVQFKTLNELTNEEKDVERKVVEVQMTVADYNTKLWKQYMEPRYK